ncbi:hypothetical protein [Occallatibacter riparius]|uniref:Lipoprotein n=1 Tax=Occallatibacter riparius TaxID=1002689 RepID=A0A9J7BJS1_9BACT|nr:hypothetical protein [Occallatibacter riparius]UWZ82034.1 hypothetical protein MOP44_15800 [Occallatibacter riparius]
MRAKVAFALVVTSFYAIATGCKPAVDRAPFKAAINKSLNGKHECVWPDAIKLPAEIDPSKDDRIRDFTALADAGLLLRETVVKGQALAGTKQTAKFDLTDQGHSSWSPDPNRPGYGNFCFGHFNVTTIDEATPNASSDPTQYTVNYHYEVEGIPAWARTPESMRAFRKVAADTAIQASTATLVKGSDGAWEVQRAPTSP